MSIADCTAWGSGLGEAVSVPSPGQARHRLRAVRIQQGMSLRTVARRMNIDVAVARVQEQESSDLLLSDLCKWQQALGVPIAELLVEPDDGLSAPILNRAKLVRVMKTAVSILERAKQLAISRLAQTLVNQLSDLMPELREVTGWPAVGQRRRLDEYGRAVGPWSLPKSLPGGPE